MAARLSSDPESHFGIGGTVTVLMLAPERSPLVGDRHVPTPVSDDATPRFPVTFSPAAGGKK
ncbi:MAG: hypothetical protein HYZ29_30680 [Myxococcales bacterium]|nr:hypothetical protein [Myxococcales bacterium]